MLSEAKQNRRYKNTSKNKTFHWKILDFKKVLQAEFNKY